MNTKTQNGMPPTVMVGIDQLRYASEAPLGLNLQVRKSSDEAGLSELEASIRTHGIIIPLVTVSHQGVLYVSAGNRRLKLMRKIRGADGTEPKVPTVDSAKFDGDPREIAMATNLGLPPHPVDRYEVIALLVKEGMTPLDAQAHFGLTAQVYSQVMRIGKMAPIIRDAWRDGEIDAGTVKAFALTDDVKEQERVYHLVKKNSYQGRVQSHEVASKFVGQQRGAGAMVEFVGLAECVKAKLKVNTDLFGTNHTVSDMKLLKKLADRKLSEACDALTLQGWAWALPKADISHEWQYSQIEPAQKNKPTPEQAKRLAEIDAALRDDIETEEGIDNYGELDEERERIEQSVKASAFTEVQRKKAGCFLSIGQDGKLLVDYGRVKPEDKKRVQASEGKRAAPEAAAGKKKGSKTDVKSAALAGRLSEQLTRAAASAIVREPKIGVAALIAGFASRESAVGVHISGDSSRPVDFVSTFNGNIKGSDENLMMLLAQICARALSFTSHNPEGVPLKKAPVAAICNQLKPAHMNAALRECFDAKDYFASIDKEPIFQAVREAMGDEHATKVAKMKRGDAAKFALANVPKTGWLPPWLRTAHYDGPNMVKNVAKTVKALKVAKPAKKAKRK